MNNVPAGSSADKRLHTQWKSRAKELEAEVARLRSAILEIGGDCEEGLRGDRAAWKSLESVESTVQEVRAGYAIPCPHEEHITQLEKALRGLPEALRGAASVPGIAPQAAAAYQDAAKRIEARVAFAPQEEPTGCRCVQGMQGCPVHDTREEPTGELKCPECGDTKVIKVEWLGYSNVKPCPFCTKKGEG